MTPTDFRAALLEVPPLERDAWVDGVLGLDEVPDDGPQLPRGCVPYLPCPIEAVLKAVSIAQVHREDVFLDLGAGVGRVAAFVGLLTGASVVGLEVQPALAMRALELSKRFKTLRFSTVVGDVAEHASTLNQASVFFLYCPFSGARLERLVDALEPIARKRTIRVCTVDVPLPERPWLELMSPPEDGLEVYRSTFTPE